MSELFIDTINLFVKRSYTVKKIAVYTLHTENLWQFFGQSKKYLRLHTEGLVMYIKLIPDEVIYSDEAQEYILPFINGHPLFKREFFIIKPGK